jgi:hypothetical protein
LERFSLRDRIGPYLVIAFFALCFFGDLVLHPSGVLYSDHSDFLAMHLPMKRFLVRSWHETGEIPLWNPHSFAGMPFVHDVQVAAFYPLHAPLYLLPESRVGAAMSWLIVLHVIGAGWCMYAYSRSRNLDNMAALVSAAGYMFAGKWLLHVLAGGHYIMIPLAWLPLVLLFLERAIERRSLLWGTWAGIVFSFIILGTHPQMTLYAGMFAAFWSLGVLFNACAIGGAPAGRGSYVARWIFMGLWALTVASALSAVQLLPALEGARESSRSAGVGMQAIFSAAIPCTLGLVGPGLTPTWEDRTGLGVLWISAALVAPFIGRSRARFEGIFCLGLLGFALGGAALFQPLPAFRLFQLPARMLMLVRLPVALLAGRTTQLLLDAGEDSDRATALYRRALPRVLLISLFLAGSAAYLQYLSWSQSQREPDSASLANWLNTLDPRGQLYWLLLGITAPVTIWLLSTRNHLSRTAWGWAWFVVLLTDCWSIAGLHVAVRPESEIYTASDCVRFLVHEKNRHPREHWRVLDPGLPGKPADAPLGPALPLLGEIQLEPVLGYNSFDLRRYKEFLQFTYGENRPLMPRTGIFGYPIIADFAVKHQRLSDLLGVRYLLRPVADERRVDQRDRRDATPWRRMGEIDRAPCVYSFLTGGMQDLPPYAVYENPTAMPRAFKVHSAKALAEPGQVFDQLCSTDFRKTALIDGLPSQSLHANATTPLVPAKIQQYLPNRVVVRTHGDDPGYLVLTDPWFPGWTCRIDGEPAEMLRADYLFRGVAVPGGEHTVSFAFAPTSYLRGKAISLIAIVAVLFASLILRLHSRSATESN